MYSSSTGKVHFVIVYNYSGHLRRMHQHMTFEEKDLKPSSAAQPNISRGTACDKCSVLMDMYSITTLTLL